MDKASTIVLASSLIIIMLGMGLSLVVDDFKRIIVYPKAIAVGLVNQLILLPLIGFAIVVIFPLAPEIAIGIMILAACPGGPTSNLIAHLAKGDTALSVTLTALSSFVTILTIPFIVNFALEHFLEEGQMIRLDVVDAIKRTSDCSRRGGKHVRRTEDQHNLRREKPRGSKLMCKTFMVQRM